MAVAYRILRDPDLAEDVTQQALLIAWRKLPMLREPDRFDAWTYRLLVNACYAETGRRRAYSMPLRLLADDAAVVDTSSQTHDRDRLERGFTKLSIAHRTVVVLHLHVGLPFEEIATMLDIPVGTARLDSTTRYARFVRRSRPTMRHGEREGPHERPIPDGSPDQSTGSPPPIIPVRWSR